MQMVPCNNCYECTCLCFTWGCLKPAYNGSIHSYSTTVDPSVHRSCRSKRDKYRMFCFAMLAADFIDPHDPEFSAVCCCALKVVIVVTNADVSILLLFMICAYYIIHAACTRVSNVNYHVQEQNDRNINDRRRVQLFLLFRARTMYMTCELWYLTSWRRRRKVAGKTSCKAASSIHSEYKLNKHS